MKPELQLSLQFADARHRDQLPRHKVVRFIRAALELPGELTVRIVDEEEGRHLNHGFRRRDDFRRAWQGQFFQVGGIGHGHILARDLGGRRVQIIERLQRHTGLLDLVRVSARHRVVVRLVGVHQQRLGFRFDLLQR